MERSSKRRKYEASFKLKLIQIAKEIGIRAAARKWDIDESVVRRWSKKEDLLRTLPKSKCALRSGVIQWPQLEDAIGEWIAETRKCGYIITRNAIKAEAMKWAISNRDLATNFKGTTGWCTRFMKRKGLVLRQRTKIAQKLPEELDDKVLDFHRYVINLRKEHNFPLSCIGNMDETPVSFDMIATRTVDFKGAKTVLAKSTGHETSRFTVALSCLADGTKLKPMVIFKRKTMPKIKFPPGVCVHVHSKGWMDETGVKLWIENVWNKRPSFSNKSMLIWDMFRSHLTENTKLSLKKSKTEAAVIPGGLTSILQPLDVSLNKPFKDHLRSEWNNWMLNGEKSYTSGGNMRAASLDKLCEFVISAWDKLSIETVKKSFKKCGISNAMDGTEDDVLWASEGESSDDESDVGWDPYDDLNNESENRMGSSSDSE